jgi:hypothetical protein
MPAILRSEQVLCRRCKYSSIGTALSTGHESKFWNPPTGFLAVHVAVRSPDQIAKQTVQKQAAIRNAGQLVVVGEPLRIRHVMSNRATLCLRNESRSRSASIYGSAARNCCPLIAKAWRKAAASRRRAVRLIGLGTFGRVRTRGVLDGITPHQFSAPGDNERLHFR